MPRAEADVRRRSKITRQTNALFADKVVVRLDVTKSPTGLHQYFALECRQFAHREPLALKPH